MWKVYVGNLHYRVREMDLADEFRAYGVVRSVWVARNPPGYAFVEFENRDDAYDAISALDGKHGWRVEMSRRSAGSRSRESRNKESRCYECGSSAHHTRDCRSRSSRSSYKRSTSPFSSHRSPSRCSRSRSSGGDVRHRYRRSSPIRRSHSRSPIPDIQHRESSPRIQHDCSSPARIEGDYARPQNSDRKKSPDNVSASYPGDSSPREVHDDSRSEECEPIKSQETSPAAHGSPREICDGSRSPNCEHRKSPQNHLNNPTANGSNPPSDDCSGDKSS